jgi:putative Holliday junction resolvase
MPAAHKTPHADTRPGRILAIDYGQKRLGLAISDEMGLTARPLATLERTNRREDLRRLREIVRQNGVGRIVVGQPLHLDGAQSEMAEEAARFAARIQKELGLPVELADERLSSWEAERVMAETRTKKRNRGRRDQVAAAVILRDYLARAKARA